MSMQPNDYQKGYDAALLAMSEVRSREHAILQRVRELAEKWRNGGPVPRAMAHHLDIALATHKGDPPARMLNQPADEIEGT